MNANTAISVSMFTQQRNTVSTFQKSSQQLNQSGMFFAKRNSIQESIQKRKRSIFGETDQGSVLEIPQKLQSSSKGPFLQIGNAGKLPAQISKSSQNLPFIEKQQPGTTKNKAQKQRYFNFKEETQNTKKENGANKYASANLEKNQNMVASMKDSRRRSLFSKIDRKKVHRTLEQTLIEDVIGGNLDNDSFSIDSDESSLLMSHQKERDNQANGHKGNFLLIHEVTPEHRQRMVDWMVLVFKVLKLSSEQTFFLAVTLLDRYFQIKSKQRIVVPKELLHLIGLVSIFISSKYEDVNPIRMEQILRDAGHNKFSQEKVLKMEKEILKTLSFNIQCKNLYEESFILYKRSKFEYHQSKLNDETWQLIELYLTFICKFIVHNMELVVYSLEDLATAANYVSFIYVKKQFECKIQKRKQSKAEQSYVDIVNEKSYTSFVGFYRSFKVQHMENLISHNQSKEISDKIINELIQFSITNQGLKNLQKHYKQFITEEQIQLFKQKFKVL